MCKHLELCLFLLCFSLLGLMAFKYVICCHFGCHLDTHSEYRSSQGQNGCMKLSSLMGEGSSTDAGLIDTETL